MVNDAEILQEFYDSKAILTGHFILSSGLHSSNYIQCAKLLTQPERAMRICRALIGKIIKEYGHGAFDLIVSPALGGILVGYEIARQLNLPFIFCERVNGEFTLRRGFEINEAVRILIVEDVFTTGKSSLETIKCINRYGGIAIGEACLVDRSNGAEFPLPLISLISLDFPTYSPDKLPENLAKIPAYSLGSRLLIPEPELNSARREEQRRNG